MPSARAAFQQAAKVQAARRQQLQRQFAERLRKLKLAQSKAFGSKTILPSSVERQPPPIRADNVGAPHASGGGNGSKPPRPPRKEDVRNGGGKGWLTDAFRTAAFPVKLPEQQTARIHEKLSSLPPESSLRRGPKPPTFGGRNEDGLIQTPGGLRHVEVPKDNRSQVIVGKKNPYLSQQFNNAALKPAQQVHLRDAISRAEAFIKGGSEPKSFSQQGHIKEPLATLKDMKISGDEYLGYKASWESAPKDAVFFKPSGKGVSVDGIWREGNPSGTGGMMLADAFKAKGITKPSFIKIERIMDKQPTTSELERGVPTGDTVLGKTVSNAAGKLGGKITNWTNGTDRDGKPWIQAELTY